MRRIVSLSMLLLLCAAFSACATAPYTGRSQLIFMDSDKEKRLGAEAAQKVRQQENIESGTRRAAMVERTGRRIAAVTGRPDFAWEFQTIRKDESNAFCLPGGKVFVYTGILDIMDGNEAELAAVIAHEIAHALARHGAESSSVGSLAGIGQLGVALAEAVLTSGAGNGASSASGALLNVGLVLPHSRTQEEEADYIGLMLMAKAGYDPEAAISFWQKMAAANRGKQPPAFLSTHPVSETRIANIRKDLPQARAYYEQSAKH